MLTKFRSTAELRTDTYYACEGWPGIAFYYAGPDDYELPEEWTLDCCEDDPSSCDHASDMCWVYNEPMIISCDYLARMVMVGDDKEHIIDVHRLTPIHEDVCSCGQLGCAWA